MGGQQQQKNRGETDSPAVRPICIQNGNLTGPTSAIANTILHCRFSDIKKFPFPAQKKKEEFFQVGKMEEGKKLWVPGFFFILFINLV